MTRLDDASRIPQPGWAFRITALHTPATGAPWLTGTWHRADRQPADPACALWLILAQQSAGLLQVALLADHEQIPGAYRPLARHDGLRPGAWSAALAPAVAAHPWVAVIHHPKPPTAQERAARAILAYLITRR
jgi:hypothetical protein